MLETSTTVVSDGQTKSTSPCDAVRVNVADACAPNSALRVGSTYDTIPAQSEIRRAIHFRMSWRSVLGPLERSSLHSRVNVSLLHVRGGTANSGAEMAERSAESINDAERVLESILMLRETRRLRSEGWRSEGMWSPSVRAMNRQKESNPNWIPY